MKIKCSYCNNEFKTFPYKVKKHKNLFCSTICQHKFANKRKTLTCRICNKPFQIGQHRIKSQKECFCSKKCADKALEAPKIKRTCKTCDRQFKFLESRLKHSNRSYCSNECYIKSRETTPNRACELCKKEFYVCKSEIQNKRGRFCSKNCYNKFCVGEDSPHYIHGHGHFKNFVTKNRSNTCSICLATGKTDVHHIDGNQFNNNYNNFITVCRSCHMQVHSISGKHEIEIKKALQIYKIVYELPSKKHSTWLIIDKLKRLNLNPLN